MCCAYVIVSQKEHLILLCIQYTVYINSNNKRLKQAFFSVLSSFWIEIPTTISVTFALKFNEWKLERGKTNWPKKKRRKNNWKKMDIAKCWMSGMTMKLRYIFFIRFSNVNISWFNADSFQAFESNVSPIVSQTKDEIDKNFRSGKKCKKNVVQWKWEKKK